jgi:DnaJ-class molecular chaperone
MSFDREMMKALEADGEKLRQLTGEDHGPVWIDDRMVVCETCGGDGFFDRVTGLEPNGTPVWEENQCPTCQGAGEYAVKVEPVTIDDISN